MYRIHELSQLTDVLPVTIRYYERRGILPRAKRASNGYRVYSENDVERLRFVSGARRLGLSLDEIAGILAFRDGDGAPCVHVQGLLEKKIADVRAEIQKLRRLEDELCRIQALGARLPQDTTMQACVCGLIKNGLS